MIYLGIKNEFILSQIKNSLEKQIKNLDIQLFNPSEEIPEDTLLIIEQDLLSENIGFFTSTNRNSFSILLINNKGSNTTEFNFPHTSISIPLDINKLINHIEVHIQKNESAIKYMDYSLTIDNDCGKLSKKNFHIVLTVKESALLKELFVAYPNFINKKDLFEHVWNLSYEKTNTHTLETHLSSLRKKISSLSNSSLSIVFDKEYGYKINNS